MGGCRIKGDWERWETDEIGQQRAVHGGEITKDRETGSKNIQIQIYDLLFSPVEKRASYI